MLPKPLEFEGVKIRIIESLPYTEEFDRIAIAHPIGYHAIRVHPIFLAGYIGDANIATSLTIISFFLSIDFSFLAKINKKQYAGNSLQEWLRNLNTDTIFVMPSKRYS